ncbi:hypothetical protein JTB14_017261 [Gonioctena quinquepunctata]|nr:hypothetical protein JTB14_017261 [Gonioctena quinquepunctata]
MQRPLEKTHVQITVRRPSRGLPKRKSTKTNAITMLSLEQRNVEHLDKVQERTDTTDEVVKDEDYYFLMNLLPHLRDIPKGRKLATRISIHQMLVTGMRQQCQVPGHISHRIPLLMIHNLQIHHHIRVQICWHHMSKRSVQSTIPCN